MLVIEFDALLHIWKSQNLFYLVDPGLKHQVQHKLKVIDPKRIVITSKTSTGIHDKIQQDPALRIHDIFHSKMRGVRFVNLIHDFFGDIRETILATIIIVYDSRSRKRI